MFCRLHLRIHVACCRFDVLSVSFHSILFHVLVGFASFSLLLLDFTLVCILLGGSVASLTGISSLRCGGVPLRLGPVICSMQLPVSSEARLGHLIHCGCEILLMMLAVCGPLCEMAE